MSKMSPFQAVHERTGANFADFGGWQMPADYGDIPAEEAALKENCAAFDLSNFGRINVKGADAADFLSKFSGPEANVPDGNWIWAKISDNNDNTIDIVRIFKAQETCTLITSPLKRDGVLKVLTESQPASLEIEDITEKTAMLGLYGPKALETVTKILPVDIPDTHTGSVVQKSFFFITVTMLRGSCNGADGVELLCPVSAASFAAGAIEKYRNRENITHAGMICLNESFKAAAKTDKIPYSGDMSLI